MKDHALHSIDLSPDGREFRLWRVVSGGRVPLETVAFDLRPFYRVLNRRRLAKALARREVGVVWVEYDVRVQPRLMAIVESAVRDVAGRIC